MQIYKILFTSMFLFVYAVREKQLATPKFKRELKRLVKKFHSLKNEYAALLDDLDKNPATGTPPGNNCYKIRIAIASKGSK